jgi:CHAT domain-containing protein
LRGAQTWLRKATDDDLNVYAKVAAAQGRLHSRQLSEIEEAIRADGPERSPSRALVQSGSHDPTAADAKAPARRYAHPYYWAGFILTGL